MYFAEKQHESHVKESCPEKNMPRHLKLLEMYLKY